MFTSHSLHVNLMTFVYIMNNACTMTKNDEWNWVRYKFLKITLWNSYIYCQINVTHNMYNYSFVCYTNAGNVLHNTWTCRPVFARNMDVYFRWRMPITQCNPGGLKLINCQVEQFTWHFVVNRHCYSKQCHMLMFEQATYYIYIKHLHLVSFTLIFLS